MVEISRGVLLYSFVPIGILICVFYLCCKSVCGDRRRRLYQNRRDFGMGGFHGVGGGFHGLGIAIDIGGGYDVGGYDGGGCDSGGGGVGDCGGGGGCEGGGSCGGGD